MSGARGPVSLVLGGARSGKSAYAEKLIRAMPAPWIYCATAQALDDEMRDRIAHHQARRAEGWITLETPLDLAEGAGRAQAPDPCRLPHALANECHAGGKGCLGRDREATRRRE